MAADGESIFYRVIVSQLFASRREIARDLQSEGMKSSSNQGKNPGRSTDYNNRDIK